MATTTRCLCGNPLPADASRARDCFLEARARLQAILAASPAQAYRSLLMRLDYNGYYAGKAGAAAAAAGAGALLSDADASSDEEDAPEPLRPTGFRWQNTRGLVEESQDDKDAHIHPRAQSGIVRHLRQNELVLPEGSLPSRWSCH